jgi:hypothetical protein
MDDYDSEGSMLDENDDDMLVDDGLGHDLDSEADEYGLEMDDIVKKAQKKIEEKFNNQDLDEI